MTDRNIVKCGDCADFKDGKYTSRINPGTCNSFEIGKAKAEKELKPQQAESQIKKAYDIRGNCAFLNCTLRYCHKFIPK